jgi:taurine dioxygenase
MLEEFIMPNWNTDRSLTWRPLAPFGAEIDHDLNSPLETATAERFVQLLRETGFVLARKQKLSMQRQQQVCGLAGPILLRGGESGYLSTKNASAASMSELRWHSDGAYTEAPLDAIALHAVEVVDGASSTCFISAQDTLTTLPADLRRRIEGRQIEMIAPSYDSIGLRTCDRPNPAAQKRGIRPAIVRNPHNGRDCIWVNEMQTTKILDMVWEDSRGLLNAIYEHLYQPAHVYKHRWCNGDFLMWDNVALQHMRGPLQDCGPRLLQRVIVGTEGVAPHIAISNKPVSGQVPASASSPANLASNT